MHLTALATDYDGTLAEDGRVAAPTLAALRSLRQSGRRLILVTGRELADLQRVFAELDVFDLVVAENGALLFEPASGIETPLAPPPPASFIERLKQLRVNPLSNGRIIVATREPNDKLVAQAIGELGLALQIIFNKGAVMVLPAGVDKATGLAAALTYLKLAARDVVAVGDAENDRAFLRTCGCAVAVANALAVVKEEADIVTKGARGAGVAELIGRLLDGDLAETTAVRHERRRP